MKRTITTWVVAALLILGLSINVDAQVVEQTCNDIFGTNQTAGVSGEWGSITFDDTSATLGVVVLEGWEVRICVKAGSAQQGDGPEDQGWLGEGEYSLTHSTGKELSHFSFAVREVPDDDPEDTTTTTTTLPTTTTTAPLTTTLPEGPTTTAPTVAQPVEWSWNVECGIVFVDFGPEILDVDLYYDGQVFYTFTEPGAYAILEDHPVTVELVPIPDGDHFPVPDSVTLTVEVCSVVPPPTEPPLTIPPTTPSGEETLPFTGPEDDLGPIAVALSTLGALILLGARTLRRDDD